MAITEGRFNRLEERVNEVFERVVAVEAKPSESASKTPWTAWLPLVAAVATIAGSIIVATLHIDSELSSMRSDISGLTTRTVKNEGAIKALADKQDQSTQNLIHDLLATAAHSNDVELAKKSVAAATQFTANLKAQNKPSSPDFFQASFDVIKQQSNPTLRPTIFNAEKSLAEYRSSLQLRINLPGTVFHCEPVATGDMPGRSFTNITFENCPKVLDGIPFKNVAFINSRIVYRGGALSLENVVFINCTFQVEVNNNGSQFLEYAALDKRELSLPSSGI